MDLIKPIYIDEKTGYRYYSFNQFHIIDRIKYLQSLGLPLEEIKSAIKSGNVADLLPLLEKRRKTIMDDIKESLNQLDSLQWYMDYFTFMSRKNNSEKLYKVRLEKRYALAVDHVPGEVPISNMELNLAKAKSLPENKQLKFLRQYAYLVDYDRLIADCRCLQKKTYWPLKYFIYLKEKPNIMTNDIIELPAGEYLCYRARILTSDWDADILKDFFDNRPKPTIVIANEFEENLKEYLNTTYEIQILLS